MRTAPRNRGVKTHRYRFWDTEILLSGKEKRSENCETVHLGKGADVKYIYKEESSWVKLKERKYEKSMGPSLVLTPGDQERTCGSFSGAELSHFNKWRSLIKEFDLCRKTHFSLKKMNLTSESKIAWRHSTHPGRVGQHRAGPQLHDHQPPQCWLQKLNSTAEPVVTLWFWLCTTSLRRRGDDSGAPGNTT